MVRRTVLAGGLLVELTARLDEAAGIGCRRNSGIFWPVASGYSMTSWRTLRDLTATATLPAYCERG